MHQRHEFRIDAFFTWHSPNDAQAPAVSFALQAMPSLQYGPVHGGLPPGPCLTEYLSFCLSFVVNHLTSAESAIPKCRSLLHKWERDSRPVTQGCIGCNIYIGSQLHRKVRPEVTS